jgi:phosphate acetyltransferase
MTQRVYVASAEGRTAKSTVAVGVLAAMMTRYSAVGVFRPVVRSLDVPDPVTSAMLAHASAELEYADCVGVDFASLHRDETGSIAAMLGSLTALEKKCDAVVIIGTDYTDVGTPTELAVNARIAADLGAQVVLVVKGTDGDDDYRSPDDIAAAAKLAVAELDAQHVWPAAIVANRCDPALVDEIAGALGAVRDALPAWAIPESGELSAPTLRQLLAASDARHWKGDEDRLDDPVLGTVVAAMNIEHVLTRLLDGGLVIVPADRSDVVIGALAAHLAKTTPNLAGLLLNGGFEVPAAVEHVIDGLSDGLPIALTELGTFQTVTQLSHVRSLLAAESPRKYAIAESIFDAGVDEIELLASIERAPEPVMTPARFEHALLERSRGDLKRIVLPEGEDERVLEAAGMASRQGLAKITILGEEAAVRELAAKHGIDLGDAAIVSTTDPELRSRFSADYAALRAHKGVSLEEADKRMSDGAYFGTMMVHARLVDGMVSGATHTTANTIRPALEIIRTAEKVSAVSSVFLMALADRVLVYGDCAIIPEPSVQELADIAIASAATALQFGIEPRVAMLSYSTGDSGSGSDVDRVRAATAMVAERAPELALVGPVQYDAATDPAVAAIKLPDSAVAGRATVFVFPDLNTGNNTYKAVQRTAGAVAIGPVLQGLAKPVNDLSRGASVRDIVNTIAITAIQAQAHA